MVGNGIAHSLATIQSSLKCSSAYGEYVASSSFQAVQHYDRRDRPTVVRVGCPINEGIEKLMSGTQGPTLSASLQAAKRLVRCMGAISASTSSNADRVRNTPEQFSWVALALVQHHLIDRCSSHSAALYLFLVTVADCDGLSYYGTATLAGRLHLSEAELVAARNPTAPSKSTSACVTWAMTADAPSSKITCSASVHAHPRHFSSSTSPQDLTLPPKHKVDTTPSW